MKKVLLAINFDEGLYNFRKELLEELLEKGYEVHIAVPCGDYTERLKAMGCILHDTALRRRGMNPLQELALLSCYRRILRRVRPDVVLTYTIKPNIYMGFLCGRYKIPCMPTITGLGTAMEGQGLLQKGVSLLYRIALERASVVFFQNTANQKIFQERKIAPGTHRMLPGSGVNLEHFTYQEFPEKGEVGFLFISRIMEEKGIEEYLDAAQAVKGRHQETRFCILGFLEDGYKGRERFERLQKEGVVEFAGSVEDVIPYLRNSQCTVHPSWYPEGMSNVCLESAACGRAVITTNRPGCRETIQDGRSGLLVRERDSRDLIDKIEYFLSLSPEQRRQMGICGRHYMEERFDRKIVIRTYIEAVREMTDQKDGGHKK